MPTHPEADYEFEFSKEEEEILRDLREHPMPDPPPVPANQDRSTDRELAVIQAAAAQPEMEGEVIATGDYVELHGRKFRVADRIGLMPLLKYSASAQLSTTDPRALGAIYTLLRDCIHPGTPACGEGETCKAGNDTMCKSYDPGDWAEFEEHAMITRADGDDLLDVITKVMEIISGRPTGPPSGSSPGRRSTRAGSTGRGSARRGRGSRR